MPASVGELQLEVRRLGRFVVGVHLLAPLGPPLSRSRVALPPHRRLGLGMRALIWLVLAALTPAHSCGINPVAANASCCECAGYSGSGALCHWCPPSSGEPGCKYRGSGAYACAGFVAQRAECPGTPCAPISASASRTPTRDNSPSRTPSPTPTAASPSPSPAPEGPLRPFTKKGVGFYGGHCDDFDILSNVSWSYDWGHEKASITRSGCAVYPSGAQLLSGVEYIPQIWGKFALKNLSDMNTTFIKGARYIFSFNEPDHSGSSYLPPEEGAARWPNMVALADAFNLTLIAPCVSNFESGQWWLETWHKACVNLTGSNCSYSHTCLHTYFEPNDVSSLFSSLERMHTAYPRPLWLNEFACPPYKHCSAADQLIFAKAVVPRLEALPYLFRYAWFEARSLGNETLLANTTATALTPLGEFYNGVPSGISN
jgi:hypothetical protein